jgi:hypothetical protein
MSGITQAPFSPLTPDRSPAFSGKRRRRLWLVAVVAAVYVTLNAPKPPHIDDGAYAYFARRFAASPLDPYGFTLLWYDYPEPANEILAPPVLPASWGAALALVGDRPWLCKLLLAPWALLFAWALDGLFRRFAPGMETPLLVLTIFSPAFLPSLNLMLDVPALALALAGVHLFLIACDRNSFGWTAGAGLVAGLGMQTKYTAFLAPAVMLPAAVLRRRWRLWPPAALAAVQVFIAWEFLVALLYGESHFLCSLRGRASGPLLEMLRDKAEFLLAQLAEYLGGLLPAVGLLGLAAMEASGRRLVAAALAILGGFAALAFLGPGDHPDQFLAADAVCSLFALGTTVVLAGVVVRLLRQDETKPPHPQPLSPETGARGERQPPHLQTLSPKKEREELSSPARPGRSETLFLLLWLGLEVLGYFALSPFPAVRRVLGIVVVLTLLAGRLAARTCATPSRRRAVWAIAAGGALLGLAFQGLDWREAQARQAGAEAAAAWVRDHGGGRVWYIGHWGFQDAAERCGMLPVVMHYTPGDGDLNWPEPSHLRPGDWLVVPRPSRVHSQGVQLSAAPLEEAVTLAFTDPVPLRTVACFYAGRVPLERHTEPRLEVVIYRVTEAFNP